MSDRASISPPDTCSGLRYAVSLGLPSSSVVRVSWLSIDGFASPEILDSNSDSLALSARDDDVLGPQIAVNDCAAVRVVEAVGRLDSDVQNVAEPERAVADQQPERRAADERHDKEDRSLVIADVIDGGDRRMVHVGDCVRFADEALGRIRRHHRRRNHLQRDVAFEQRIAREVDDTDSVPANLANDFVPVR